MLKYIKNIINKDDKNDTSLLEIHSKRFEYISNSISKKKNEILKSNDNIGGYYQNKIILPKNITVSKNNIINIQCFVYKILFSTISNNKNYYLSENKINLDYILIASMITVKTINKIIKKIYPNVKNLIRNLNPIIIHQRKDIVKKRSLLLEIILTKLMYEKNKINTYTNLNKEEKEIIYEIENIKNITNRSLNKKLESIYKKIMIIHKRYEHINLNLLWGYLYYKKINKETKNIKDILKNKKHTNEILIQKNTIKNKKKTDTNKNKNNLNLLFDHKKTIDEYKKGNKNYDSKNIKEDSDILKDLNLNSSTKSSEHNTSILKNKILNNITFLNMNNKKENLKKYSYKEWDFKIKQYKNNWCNIFVKLEQNSTNENQEYINNIIKLHKNDITRIRNKISLITNEKIWKNRKTHGEDIDFDTLIANYNEVKNETFNKIYKFKKKCIKNIAIILLFDSSLSTDGYTNKKKIIDFIKEITIILNQSIKNDIPEHLIATFYSNTRHDCTYKIIKKIKEKEIKNNIKTISPNGYTRIGPAIRHSIKELNNIKSKKKIILLLTDGNPTDYDEYEGTYGISDIKIAIQEAKKLKISIKCIIINEKPDHEFVKIFKNNNLNLDENVMCKQLITFIKKILTE